jgi:hypothetical protein
MNGRCGPLLPRAAARVWAYRMGASQEHVACRKRRSTSCGRQIVRRHPKSYPVQNTVPFGTRHFVAKDAVRTYPRFSRKSVVHFADTTQANFTLGVALGFEFEVVLRRCSERDGAKGEEPALIR